MAATSGPPGPISMMSSEELARLMSCGTERPAGSLNWILTVAWGVNTALWQDSKGVFLGLLAESKPFLLVFIKR